MTTTRLCELHLLALPEDDFEEWLCLFLQETRGLSVAPQRVGRRGQKQKGVDVFTRLPEGQLLGIQAKAYVKKRLTKSAFLNEVKAAHKFEPPLDHYVVCTLNERDAAMQEQARKSTIHGQQSVSILALQDLAEQAARHPRLVEDLVQRAGATYVDAVRQVLSASQPAAAMAPIDDSTGPKSPLLQRIEAWIDAGQPQRALDELATADVDEPVRRRLEARVHFALGDLDAVVNLARDDQSRATPDPLLLASGGHAAQVLGDQRTADELLELALGRASQTDRPEIVAAYLRVHANRSGSNFASLEQFACDQLGDPMPVALALADSAFMLGAMDVAIEWYRRVRESRPQWPVGAQINALGAEIWQLIFASIDGESVEDELRDRITRLKTLTTDESIKSSGMRVPMLINLGHAYRAVQEYQCAAEAWDEALALPKVDASIWLHRCVLCTNERVPLPSASLINLWAITPIARLVLASACIALGETLQADALIEKVLQDGTTSDSERVIAQIEKIRLRTGAQDDRVTASDVATMLGLYDQGNRTVQLLSWLVFHFGAASAAEFEQAREAIKDLTLVVPMDPLQRLTITEDLLRAGLDDIALAWLPSVDGMALDENGQIASMRAARVLLRLYVHSFRFERARTLIAQLRARRPDDAGILLEGAHSLEQAGDRMAAYELLTDAIRNGQLDASILLSWARVAVVVKRRHEAERLMRGLAVVPQDPESYAQILQARAWLGVRGQDQSLLASGATITPETAGKIFGTGIIGRPHRQARVAYGRVVHVRIACGDSVRFDERIAITDSVQFTLPGVKVLDANTYLWINELLDARVGDSRVLTTNPFEHCTATILDVVEADRWSVIQARDTVQLLPADASGVRAVAGDVTTLLESMRQQAKTNQDIFQGVLQTASQRSASIALTAAALRVTPRALFQKSKDWTPPGPSGSADEIAEDDRALAHGDRLVLDPITVLLLVELGAEVLISRMGQKPVITPQGAQQLFDWWYAFERPRQGKAGTMSVSDTGKLVYMEQNAAYRLEVRSYWKRVQNLVIQHLEVIDPPPTLDTEILRYSSVLGPAMTSGMALAKDRGWVYVTEEPMVRAIMKISLQGQVTSLHRLIVYGAELGWLPRPRATTILANLIRRGWRWVSFPASFIRAAFQLPASERWSTATALLQRVREADPGIAIRVLSMLLLEVDAGGFRGASPKQIRKLISKALPRGWPAAYRVAMAEQFAQLNPGRRHRASRRCLNAWASEA